MTLPFRLNGLQRAILIATAGVIIAIQLTGIANRGLDENSGWVWALLAATGLLVIGFSPNPSTETREGDQRQPSPGQLMKAPPADVMSRFAAQMASAGRVVAESERIGARLLEFVKTNNLYHQSGTLAWVLHPAINSVLAAHSLVVLAVDESKVQIDPLLWETYRTTLAHRLAQKRAGLFPELTAALESTDGPSKNPEKPDRAYVDLTKGEMKLWEDVVKKSAAETPAHKHVGLLAHFAATFGGRKSSVDDTRFAAIFSECYEDARQRIVPLLSMTGRGHR